MGSKTSRHTYCRGRKRTNAALSHPCMPPSESLFCPSYRRRLYWLPWRAVIAPSDKTNHTCFTQAGYLLNIISLRRFVFKRLLTSRWPLKAAWCRAVRPARSDTLTLLSSGTKASAHRTALLAAATCRGVCQFLSRAFTSAECFSKTCTASCRTKHNL